ncbi:hypothetical protein GGTG_11146 [Gaeumannomyces tritici R3-111a-1]|uniref:Uncharacterized protein n=1 Tax=Gaeumannomyces tritici (strain R3-111a-1) TaxID=644352 RepID=J3PCC3_GAET3|nr:hypothetical protein GGTG_11146 [Gaeumannomyces tritici R3-111a-1]EJT71893.1 hypothetical protein GGTG_11146 [Gaeumannomyces tritici R3-111a-1]
MYTQPVRPAEPARAGAYPIFWPGRVRLVYRGTWRRSEERRYVKAQRVMDNRRDKAVESGSHDQKHPDHRRRDSKTHCQFGKSATLRPGMVGNYLEWGLASRGPSRAISRPGAACNKTGSLVVGATRGARGWQSPSRPRCAGGKAKERALRTPLKPRWCWRLLEPEAVRRKLPSVPGYYLGT